LTRFLVFARLLKIDAVTGTVERHLALLAATLRANPAMHGGTEAFLLALFANRTTHSVILLEKIMPENRNGPVLGTLWVSATLAGKWAGWPLPRKQYRRFWSQRWLKPRFLADFSL
jgi:hypothetical protein